MSRPGRPKGEYRSAQHEGSPVRPKGRPKGEYRSAQREGSPMAAARGRMAAAACALLLAGCATFSSDGGMDDVTRLAQERIGAPAAAVPAARDADAARARSDALLRAPLTADAAVEVALLRNPALRVRLGELGLAEADLVQAGRLRNPVFAYSNKRNADVTQIERTVLVNIAALVMMPLALEIEERRFAQARLATAAEIVATAAAVRQAYVRAVAAQEMAAYAAQVVLSAEASSELARRMQQVGQLEPPGADARAGVLRRSDRAARAGAAGGGGRARAARRACWDCPGADAAFVLPAHLPDLPATPFAPADAERTAMERRLDVQVAKLDAEGVAKSLGLTRATRFVNVLEVGYTNESRDRRRAQERLRDRARAAAVRLGRGARRARRDPLPAGAGAHVGSRDQRAIGGARGVRRHTARRTTSRSTTATRSCRCASASPRRTCCATTAC